MILFTCSGSVGGPLLGTIFTFSGSVGEPLLVTIFTFSGSVGEPLFGTIFAFSGSVGGPLLGRTFRVLWFCGRTFLGHVFHLLWFRVMTFLLTLYSSAISSVLPLPTCMSGAITSKEKLEQEKAARTIFSRLMRFERTDISVLNSAHEYKRRGSLVYLQLLIVKYLFPLPFKKIK